MIIREEIEVRAPLDTVWNTFSCLEDWSSWNSVCRTCAIDTGDGLEKGACFSFTVRPYNLPIRISPTVTHCDPGRKVVWAGSRFGIHAEHTFLFEEKNGAIKVTSIEEFSGALLLLSRVLFVPQRLHRLTRRLLAEIKARSEGCAA